MKQTLKSLLSNNPNVSSKRVAGFGGWVIFCGIILGSFIFSLNINDKQESLMETLAYSSVVLIAGGTLETVFRRKQK